MKEKPDFGLIADNDPSILNHDVYTGFVHGCEYAWRHHAVLFENEVEEQKKFLQQEINDWEAVREFIENNEDDEDNSNWIPDIVLRRLKRLMHYKSEYEKLTE